ncbi:MAG: DUF3052 family protein [Caulobacter sp.]|nr:DUF3052 family protein [Caulobacter sp.]
MGKDVQNVPATFPGADGGEDVGRLQWEPPRLIFRSASRRVFEGPDLTGIGAEAGVLRLANGAGFRLGEPFAERWAQAIANPPGRLDKLGVKPGQRLALLDLDDAEFRVELSRITQPVNEFSELDILFWAADDPADLDRLPDLIPMLAPGGALWLVSRKGKAATLKDVQIMAAARPLGLVDNKVCAFSDTHTALRFVRRR